jgi:hypothetical protein
LESFSAWAVELSSVIAVIPSIIYMANIMNIDTLIILEADSIIILIRIVVKQLI